MSEQHRDPSASRATRLDGVLTDLLRQTPEVEAAAVVSFDGLPMASALPASMDEDRVAAMSAALLSLGERAAQGLGRGELNQVWIEGDSGTVFLVSCDDEAVLVAVAAAGAKAGMMLYEVKRSAAAVAAVLQAEELAPVASLPVAAAPAAPVAEVPAQAVEPLLSVVQAVSEPVAAPVPAHVPAHVPASVPAAPAPSYDPLREPVAPSWSSYAPSGSVLPGEPPRWS